MTVPAPLSIIAGNAARVSCITAVTLTSSWDCSTAGSAVQKSPDGAEAGVVHQHVDAGREPFGDLGPAGGFSEIGRQHFDAAAALVGQLGGQLVEPVRITGHQHNVVAVGGVTAGETLADSGSGPGDQGDATRHGVSVRGESGATFGERGHTMCPPSSD